MARERLVTFTSSPIIIEHRVTLNTLVVEDVSKLNAGGNSPSLCASKNYDLFRIMKGGKKKIQKIYIYKYKKQGGETGEFSVEHVRFDEGCLEGRCKFINGRYSEKQRVQRFHGLSLAHHRPSKSKEKLSRLPDSSLLPSLLPAYPIVPSAKNFADLLIILDPSLPWLLSSEHRFPPFGPNPKRVRPFVPTLETPCTCVFYTRNV